MKIYTPEEAAQALPRVRELVTDLRDQHRLWRDGMRRYEIAVARSRAEQGEPPAAVAIREQIASLAARIEALMAALRDLGIEVKDIEAGLVDFYSLLEDRLVFLCWRLGEEQVDFWHEVDAGFAGRRPIAHTPFTGIVP
jgi:hypothetical protein